MVTEEKKGIYSSIPANMQKYFRKAEQYCNRENLKNLILMIGKGGREDLFFLFLSLLFDLSL